MSQTEKITLFLIITFTVILFIMGLFFFYLFQKYHAKLIQRQQEALNNLLIGQEIERERLARDIHDTINPELSSIIFTIDRIKTEDSEIIELKEKSKSSLHQSIKHVRQISHNLTSFTLSKYGLAEAIEDYIEELNTNIKFHFDTDCYNLKFNSDTKIHVFKILQELCQNSIKHSHAKMVKISFNEMPNEFIFHYEDDGKGYDNTEVFNNGIGVKNMKTRAGILNAKLNIQGNNGFHFSMTLNKQQSLI